MRNHFDKHAAQIRLCLEQEAISIKREEPETFFKYVTIINHVIHLGYSALAFYCLVLLHKSNIDTGHNGMMHTGLISLSLNHLLRFLLAFRSTDNKNDSQHPENESQEPMTEDGDYKEQAKEALKSMRIAYEYTVLSKQKQTRVADLAIFAMQRAIEVHEMLEAEKKVEIEEKLWKLIEKCQRQQDVLEDYEAAMRDQYGESDSDSNSESDSDYSDSDSEEETES